MIDPLFPDAVIILDVAKDSPEVLKQESFDQSRLLSDSEDEIAESSKSKKKDAHAEELALLQETFDIMRENMTGFSKARQDNLEITKRREEREIRAEQDRIEDIREERELRKRKFDADVSNAQEDRADRDRRYKLEEARDKRAEEERRDQRWETARQYLNDPNELVRRRGERMMKKLEKEEEEMEV